MKKDSSRFETALVSVLIIGMSALTYSTFSASYPSERTVPIPESPPLVSEQTRTEPYLSTDTSISNDFQTTFGPWWLSGPFSQITVFNPTRIKFVVEIGVKLEQAFCSSDRIVTVTSRNESRNFKLSASKPEAHSNLVLALSPMSSTNIALQVSGAVCQAENDPRLFWGQVTVEKFLFQSATQFDFSSSD